MGQASSISGHATPAVWTATMTIAAGSVVTAIGLIEWVWPVFWVGIGLMVLGSIGAWRVGIMNSVSEFAPPAPPADERSTT